MHFFSLQYWHLFLLIRSIEHCWFFVHGLYWIFCWMLRLKKPCGAEQEHRSAPETAVAAAAVAAQSSLSSQPELQPLSSRSVESFLGAAVSPGTADSAQLNTAIIVPRLVRVSRNELAVTHGEKLYSSSTTSTRPSVRHGTKSNTKPGPSEFTDSLPDDPVTGRSTAEAPLPRGQPALESKSRRSLSRARRPSATPRNVANKKRERGAGRRLRGRQSAGSRRSGRSRGARHPAGGPGGTPTGTSPAGRAVTSGRWTGASCATNAEVLSS